ncbi:hypothetical protein I3760_04G033100 [Carya illinoinensis]|nr:hypothetical protein I3760_04G033100 [Carya illinoinensis]
MDASTSGTPELDQDATIPSQATRSRSTSRVQTSCASSRFSPPVDVEDEDAFNEEEEIAIGDESDVPPTSARPLQPQSNKKNSWIWEHFTKVDGNSEELQARCHHYGQHVRCHSEMITEDEILRDTLAEMIIEDDMPFTTVDKRGFRKFVKLLKPRFLLPSRYTVMRDCMKRHANNKAEMRKMFVTTSQRVSFTTDTWTSVQNVSYMCITAHYIDNGWNLKKQIIGFKEIVDYKGASIGAEMDDCLKDWGIQKVLCITVNSASSNDTAIEWFKQNTRVKDDVIRNHEFIHIQCFAHIINLIVAEGLKEVDDSITKVRNIVQYVRASPQRLKKFRAIGEQLGISCSKTLCLDIPTRWNSTYMMLDVAQKYQKVFERMEVEDEGLKYALLEPIGNGLGPPNTHDWMRVGYFVTFLHIFYDITMRISGSAYMTANLWFSEVSALHHHLQEGCDDPSGLLSGMAERMQTKYDKYLGQVEKINRLLFVAVILDPRVKLAVIEFWANSVLGLVKASSFITALKTDLNDLYNHYSNSGRPSSATITSNLISTPPSDDFSPDGALRPRHRSYNIMSEYHQFVTLRNIMQCTSEIEQYFMEEVETPSAVFQILTWWKANSTKYPILSRIARDVLAIPITTVASESVFSTGGRVLDAFRSSLSPSIMEALVCTQNWISDTPLGLDSIGIDAESYKLESGFEIGPIQKLEFRSDWSRTPNSVRSWSQNGFWAQASMESEHKPTSCNNLISWVSSMQKNLQ